MRRAAEQRGRIPPSGFNGEAQTESASPAYFITNDRAVKLSRLHSSLSGSCYRHKNQEQEEGEGNKNG